MTKLFSTAYFVGSWSNNWSLWGDNIGFGMGSKMGRCPPTSCCLHEGRQGVLWLHWCMFIDWKKFFLYGYAKLAILIIDCLWVAGNCWGRYLCLWWPLPNHGSLWFWEWHTLLVCQELLDTTWGEDGYIRILRGVNRACGPFGITQRIVYPVKWTRNVLCSVKSDEDMAMRRRRPFRRSKSRAW